MSANRDAMRSGAIARRKPPTNGRFDPGVRRDIFAEFGSPQAAAALHPHAGSRKRNMMHLDSYTRLFPRRIVRAMRNLWLFVLDLRDRLRGGDDSIPPRSLHYVGGGDFKAIGERFVEHFIHIGGLRPDETVLDIGCGTGRMALPLLRYLDDAGRYIGFDISDKAIAWCKDNIHARNSHFLFHYANIYNKEYNPRGTISAADYTFPCDDGSVDFAYATSLFTHLREAEASHYLSEVGRVLKPSGRAMLNFFIMDDTSRRLMAQGESSMDFSIELPDGYTIDAKTPERAVAYSDTTIMQLIADAGLQLSSPILFGDWSGRPSMLDSQDIVLVRKVVE